MLFFPCLLTSLCFGALAQTCASINGNGDDRDGDAIEDDRRDDEELRDRHSVYQGNADNKFDNVGEPPENSHVTDIGAKCSIVPGGIERDFLCRVVANLLLPARAEWLLVSIAVVDTMCWLAYEAPLLTQVAYVASGDAVIQRTGGDSDTSAVRHPMAEGTGWPALHSLHRCLARP